MFWDRNQAKVDELNMRLEHMTAEKLALEQRLEESKNVTHNWAEAEQTYKQQIAELKSTLKDIEARHMATVVDVKKSVNKEINRNLASIGVKTFANEIFAVNSDPSDQEILNKFNGLTGNEKTEFYTANKVKITRALLGGKQ